MLSELWQLTVSVITLVAYVVFAIAVTVLVVATLKFAWVWLPDTIGSIAETAFVILLVAVISGIVAVLGAVWLENG